MKPWSAQPTCCNFEGVNRTRASSAVTVCGACDRIHSHVQRTASYRQQSARQQRCVGAVGPLRPQTRFTEVVAQRTGQSHFPIAAAPNPRARTDCTRRREVRHQSCEWSSSCKKPRSSRLRGGAPSSIADCVIEGILTAECSDGRVDEVATLADAHVSTRCQPNGCDLQDVAVRVSVVGQDRHRHRRAVRGARLVGVGRRWVVSGYRAVSGTSRHRLAPPPGRRRMLNIATARPATCDL